MDKIIENIIRENVRKILIPLLNEIYLDEANYPLHFNIEDFKAIKTFKGKKQYALDHLGKQIGAGSSRVIFKIDDHTVIKIAKNAKGLAQNEAESEGFKQNYDIIARVYDIDNDDMWIEMEYAKKITPARFKELSGGMSLDDVIIYLKIQKGSFPYDKNDSYEKNRNFIDKYKSNEFIQKLHDFVFSYDYPVPGDFGRISTYGEVMRDGKPRVVLIDFGATEDVVSSYYNWSKK